MAELTFRSPGVSTREIDLSQNQQLRPQGVPAGIIGTALDGPAFVPTTVATNQEFISIFGEADSKNFGPLAAREWLKNARSCTFIRILGIGDGKKRNTSTGVVTNAGYFVGDRQVQPNGLLGNNAYANDGDGSSKGRTYFLGCYMSESNGATIFSDAGIQSTTSKLSKSEGGLTGSASWALNGINGNSVILSDGILAFTGTFSKTTNNADSTLTTIGVQDLAAGNAAQLASGIKSWSDLTIQAGLSMDISIASNIITFNAQRVTGIDANGREGVGGYRVADVSSATHLTTNSEFTRDATGGAIPILRGVVLAPSGVILHLSGASSQNTDVPLGGLTAAATGGSVAGRMGAITGSVNLKSQEFVMLMNGYKSTPSSKSCITASFDVTAPNYFRNVLNTDPLKLEEKGHFLYSSYDIHPNFAVLTGSGLISAGTGSKGTFTPSLIEDIAFLLTGSNERGLSSGLGNNPDYEDFRDRFSHAHSPFFISQSDNDLFRLVSLSPGENISNKFKISIENLRPSTSKINKYGTFDLIIRGFKDSDTSKQTLETFRNVNLDPKSDRYISRVIGDINKRFVFDTNAESQKIVIDGSHINRSKYVRVEVHPNVENQNEDAESLPVGFRGPNHLVVSGSLLSKDSSPKYFAKLDSHNDINEIPIPYRKNLNIGLGINKTVETRLCWGVQTNRPNDVLNPNKESIFNETIESYVKFFPTHRKDTTPFSVGGNKGASNVNGSILDSDIHNKNKFTLMNIQVRTGSSGKADTEQWISASYVRGGSIPVNDTNKTRGFLVSDLSVVANRKYAKFSTFLQGGFNGVNIFNLDKKNLENNAAKRESEDSNQGGISGPTISAYRKAIDIMESKSDVDIQVLAIPGLRHASVTDYAISAVENRFDAFYIMDIEQRDQLNNVITSSVQDPHVGNTIIDFKNRGLNTSFAAAYFPDVTMINPSDNSLIPSPPSVAILGAFSQNDKIGHPWFAPAGFTRGALNSVEVESVKLSRENLDDLYDADINPITSFPSTGITVFGQKTLLQDPSALDRINVRRLLIDIRRKVRNVANTLLFEPNRSETLEKFSGLVNPILQNVQNLSGVERYKVVIDTSTTTQADVENNTIRGKIFLQPTRTVEFVALDFVVTNAGSDLL